MLEVCKKSNQGIQTPKEKHDIIVTKYQTITEYTEDGAKIERKVPVYVNITKKVNETMKLIKQNNAEEIIAQVERLVSKGV